MKIYKQLKDLPFSQKGSIWKIQKINNFEKIVVNGSNYGFIDTHKSLVKYYTEESGAINMDDGEWFELAGTEDEKREQRKEEIRQLVARKDYLKERINEIDDTLERIK